MCIFSDDRGCSWHWVCKLYLAHFFSPIICTLRWCQDKDIIHSTQAPLAKLEQGKETFYLQRSGGAEDVAANIVLAISLLPIMRAVIHQSCECNTSSSLKWQTSAPNDDHWADPALQRAKEEHLHQCRHQMDMGEFLLCWWELKYWTDAEENVMFAKASILFLKNEQATPTS